MMTRMQVTLSEDLLQHARRRASRLGISLAEHIRRLIAADTEPSASPSDVGAMFDLGHSGGSDIARHESAYLAAAVSER